MDIFEDASKNINDANNELNRRIKDNYINQKVYRSRDCCSQPGSDKGDRDCVWSAKRPGELGADWKSGRAKRSVQ